MTDLEREVRAAVEVAWVNASGTKWRALDELVPVVVRLIEAHRAPLIEGDLVVPGEVPDGQFEAYWRDRAEKAEQRVAELEAQIGGA